MKEFYINNQAAQAAKTVKFIFSDMAMNQLCIKLGYIASSRPNLHWSSGIKDAHYSLHNFPGIYQDLCEHKKCSEVGCLFLRM